MTAEVTILNVMPNLSSFLVAPLAGLPAQSLKYAEVELESQRLLYRTKKKYEDSGVTIYSKLLKGDPAYSIIKEAEAGKYDMIIMANRGLSEISEFLMGSVSSKVVRHASCPVLIVR